MKHLYLDAVPEELKRGVRHVCWRHECGTKVPKTAGTLTNASSTNSRTWRTFQECSAAMRRYPDRYAGVGRVIAKDDSYVGVDLDDVRDPETSVLTSRADEIVRLLNSYCEVLPSETGVKLWVRATLERAYKKPGIEVYSHGRYFTLTGWRLGETPRTVEPRQAELEALLREEFPEPEKKPSRSYEDKPGERIDLVEFLSAAGVVIFGEVPDGAAERVFRIRCPWLHEQHTGGDRSGTRAGQYADGATWFHCEHSHCAHRGWAEFRREVDPRVPRKIKVCGARRVWRRPA